ncbi:hypothetical protein RvY_02897 [Ramazzottius varieornatus]|uniref:N-acetylgalactosaminide beta-1,3-galactosyltransferase n=1 Tax=Ramazzottius varieornatus TaxID=947166 RepID=A0A1D1UPP5_RAMVA|nr:hypothetical protein RvY_02897 [Ramazzottius varieornatus]
MYSKSLPYLSPAVQSFLFGVASSIFVLSVLLLISDHRRHKETDLSMLYSSSDNHKLPETSHDYRKRDSQRVRDKPRIFCWIMTSPRNEEKVNAVKATWARRCNRYIFVSSENNSTIPSIDAGVPEGREYLWGKTKFGYEYAYNTSLEGFDWFLKADDDTFVVVENLRSLLSTYSESQPYYIGCSFRPFTAQGYMSGGAGYALNRLALRRFVENGLRTKVCRTDPGGYEDAEMGICLDKLGVNFADSRDGEGKSRFFPFSHFTHIQPNRQKNYLAYLLYPEKDLLDCCSDSAVSFHYISPYYMYFLEYFIYQLSPFGSLRL